MTNPYADVPPEDHWRGDDLFDIESELRVLATACLSPESAEETLNFPAAAFYVPSHGFVAEVVKQMLVDGEEIDPSTVMVRAAERAGSPARGDAVRKVMVELLGRALPPSTIEFHVNRLLHFARARKMVEIGVRLSHAATQTPDDLDEIVRFTLADIESQDIALLSGQEPERYSDLRNESVDYDWLVPHLLETTDRLVITGMEGLGKSVWLAQFAATLAGGLHPILASPLGNGGPKSVLVVDAENSRRQVTRRYNDLIRRVDRRRSDAGLGPANWDQSLGFLLKPEGLFLNEPMSLRLLENVILTQKPDVVVAGPLYRLHSSDTKEEQAAKELINIIDRLRVKYRFAFVCEAHANHGAPGQNRPLRPTGSSVFLRWPEFGIGLRPTPECEGMERPDKVQVTHWRGARDERIWPKTLQHSVVLPWGAGDEGYYQRHADIGYI